MDLNLVKSISTCVDNVQAYVLKNLTLEHWADWSSGSLQIVVPYEIDHLLAGLQNNAFELAEEEIELILDLISSLWALRSETTSFLTDVHAKLALVLPGGVDVVRAEMFYEESVGIIDRETMDPFIPSTREVVINITLGTQE